MYIPAHFKEIDSDEVASVVRYAPLASIVAQTDEGLIANHIPLLVGPDGTLVGHIARANDMHRLVPEGQEVLAIFRGDDAYVSPNYYPTKAEHRRHVPTWNYQAVHVYGTISFQHEEQAKRAAVGLLTRDHERRVNGAAAWRMADAPPDFLNQMLTDIVAFRISANRTLAKSKLSQTREMQDALGVVEGLRAAGHSEMSKNMASKLADRD